MDKDSRPRRAAAQRTHRESDRCTPPRDQEDGRTRRTKRKTSPDNTNPRKRTRVSESEPRKTPEEESLNAPPKKMKRRLLKHDSSDPLEGCSSNMDATPRRGAKRKAAADGEEPNRKRKRSEEERREAPNKKTKFTDQRAEFESKYVQRNLLGSGGCGSVYAGYRRADKLPVAIKHVARDKVFVKHQDEHRNRLSVEVAVLLKLADATNGPVGTSPVISLLDWYDLGQKLILVMERPVPSQDLLNYIEDNDGALQEEQAKIIMKQLVDATLNLQENHVFHRDIKVENILIETGSDVPRVRLIDFGMSCFEKKRSTYRRFFGTPDYITPELLAQGRYKAGPTTVWQLGVALFEMLHSGASFETIPFVIQRLRISGELSQECQDCLRKCLTLHPKRRITLQQLQLHPWLR